MRKIPLATALATVALLAAWPTAAEAQQGQLDVRLVITESCDVSGSGGNLGNALLDFGTWSLLDEEIDAQTGTMADALVILCNPGVMYTLEFDAGQNATDIANRAMERTSGTELVRYQLYTTSARTTVLEEITGTADGTPQVITVYGRVPAQTAPPVGTYTDVVTITLSF